MAKLTAAQMRAYALETISPATDTTYPQMYDKVYNAIDRVNTLFSSSVPGGGSLQDFIPNNNDYLWIFPFILNQRDNTMYSYAECSTLLDQIAASTWTGLSRSKYTSQQDIDNLMTSGINIIYGATENTLVTDDPLTIYLTSAMTLFFCGSYITSASKIPTMTVATLQLNPAFMMPNYIYDTSYSNPNQITYSQISFDFCILMYIGFIIGNRGQDYIPQWKDEITTMCTRYGVQPPTFPAASETNILPYLTNTSTDGGNFLNEILVTGFYFICWTIFYSWQI